jgi:hypothetical protein
MSDNSNEPLDSECCVSDTTEFCTRCLKRVDQCGNCNQAPQAASKCEHCGQSEDNASMMCSGTSTHSHSFPIIDSVTISVIIRDYPDEAIQLEWYSEFQKKQLFGGPKFSLQEYADYAIKKAVDWQIQQALKA